ERAVGVRVDAKGNLLEWDAKAPGLNDAQFFTMRDLDANSQTQKAQNEFRLTHPLWEKMVQREGVGNILVDFHKMTQAAFRKAPASRGRVKIRLALRRNGKEWELDQVHGDRPLPLRRFEAVFEVSLQRGSRPGQYEMSWRMQHGRLPHDVNLAFSYLKKQGE
ncbi:MAG: hypothetical protein R3257_01960, partial [bacterium]|nr:hypothetical protein [bacterium]